MFDNVILPDFLVNARARSKENKNFHVPNKKKIQSLIPGNLVKISNGEERFWVKILQKQKVEDGNIVFIGEVTNKLLNPTQYDLGDEIYFISQNIIDIFNQDYIKWTKENNLSGLGFIASDVNQKK